MTSKTNRIPDSYISPSSEHEISQNSGNKSVFIMSFIIQILPFLLNNFQNRQSDCQIKIHAIFNRSRQVLAKQASYKPTHDPDHISVKKIHPFEHRDSHKCCTVSDQL